MANPALAVPSLATRSHTREVMLVLIGITVALGGSVVIGMTNYGLWVVGGVLVLVAGGAVLLRPELGLFFLYFFIFSNMSALLETRYGVPDLNKFLVMLMLVGTLANRVILLRKPLIFGITEIAVMLYGGAVIGSLLLAPNGQVYPGEIVSWLKDFLIFLIIVQFGTDEKIWKRTQWVLIITAAILGMFNAYQLVTQNYQANFMGFANVAFSDITTGLSGHRLTGPLDDPNHYGMVQMMVLPLALYRFLTDAVPRNRWLGLGASAFILIAVVGSYSRGAFLALVVVGFLMLRERRINMFNVILVILFISLVIVPFLPKGFVDRMTSLKSLFTTDLASQTDTSLRGRSSEAIVAMQMFRDYPVLGIGRGHYATNYIAYASGVGLDNRFEQREAHSLYLELAAETGVIGIMSFGLMMFLFFRGMRQASLGFKRLNRPDLVYWVSGVKYGLIANPVASIFLHSNYIRYFWLMAGLAASSSVLVQALRLRLMDSRIVSRISPIT